MKPNQDSHKSSIQHPASSIRPFIIPVFLPHHGCPHHCTFCNQKAITRADTGDLSSETLRSQVVEFLSFNKKQRRPVQIAFYGGNFLGVPPDTVKRLLAEAARFVADGRVDSIRFSTRPDTIDNRRLDAIADYPVATIEIGAQSMDDQVLATANRGHSSLDTETAVRRLKARKYEIGIQIMAGLPGDDETKAMATGRRIAAMGPDFVRIYPAVVLAGSRLAKWYQQGDFTPWALERCVTLVKRLYLLFHENNIRVVRMGLQAAEDLSLGSNILAGPYHPAFGHLVHSEILLDKAAAAIAAAKDKLETVTLKVHPKSISKMRGLNNSNLEILQRKFQIKTLHIVPDPDISENSLAVT